MNFTVSVAHRWTKLEESTLIGIVKKNKDLWKTSGNSVSNSDRKILWTKISIEIGGVNSNVSMYLCVQELQ